MNTTAGPRILVVDDEPGVLQALHDTLQARDFSVTSCGSARRALEILRSEPIDIVLSDLNMPEMSGVQFLTAALQIDGDLVAVMMTGQGTIESAVSAMKAGALDYILKPLSMSNMLPVLERAREIRRIRQVNKDLQRRLEERGRELEAANLELAEAQNRLRAWNEELEVRVKERTAELRAEMAERRRIEEALRLNEESIRIALQSVDMTLFRQDRDLRYTWFHRSQPGAGQQRVVGLTDFDILPAGEARVFTELKRRAIETGEIVYEQVAIQSERGRKAHFQIVIQPLRDADGSIAGVTGSTLDITARVRLKRAAQKSEALFRAILEAAPDAILIMDGAGRIVLTNPAAQAMFGESGERLDGRDVETLIPGLAQPYMCEGAPDERPLAWPSEGSAMRRMEGLRKDGTRFPLEVALSPMDSRRGRLGVGIARDVTEQRKLEAQLQQSRKMEAIGQLTGGIAHDFNNLLGVIIGNLDLVEEQIAENDAARKRVGAAQKASVRAADLTRRLLAFSRRQHLKPEAVSLKDAIENLKAMASHTFGPDIRISTNLSADLAPVFVDSSALENALLNLAINARDAMPNGGTLTISTKARELGEDYPAVKAGELQAGTYACVSLSDTGTGIPREALDRVFEPFFTTKGRGKGTGLGLAMVYGFVKQSNGHVGIYSEVGQGTTVTLCLPFAAGGATVLRPASAQAHRSYQGMTALAVDDESELLEVATTYLEAMGFRVLQAADGPGALQVAGKEPGIDLLLTDVIMPGGMTGAELAQRIRERLPGTRIIFSTGFSSNALRERSGLRLEGVVLGKPFRRNEFVAAIDEVMGAPDSDHPEAASRGGDDHDG